MKRLIPAFILSLLAVSLALWPLHREMPANEQPQLRRTATEDRTHSGEGSSAEAGNRFAGLEPRLQKVMLELDSFRKEWRKKHILTNGAGLVYDPRWRGDLLVELQSLSASDITAILIWDSHAPGDDESFRAFFTAMTQRLAMLDPPACRSLLLDHWDPAKITTRYEALKLLWSGYYCGFSQVDPVAALQVFKEDDTDTFLDQLIYLKVPDDLYSNAAAVDPVGTWGKALGETNLDHFNGAMNGYFHGVPAGRNWAELAEDAQKSLSGLATEDYLPQPFEKQKSDLTDRLAAQRWMLEDPVAALEWYGARDRREDVGKLDPEQIRRAREKELIVDFAGRYWLDTLDGLQGVMKGLMISQNADDQELAISSLAEIVDPGRQPSWFAILATVQDTPTRSQIFLHAVDEAKARVRKSESFSGRVELEIEDGPNPYVENLRPWIAKMGLSAEDAATAEAKLQAIEDKEASIRRGKPQEQGADEEDNDPFAPGNR